MLSVLRRYEMCVGVPWYTGEREVMWSRKLRHKIWHYQISAPDLQGGEWLVTSLFLGKCKLYWFHVELRGPENEDTFSFVRADCILSQTFIFGTRNFGFAWVLERHTLHQGRRCQKLMVSKKTLDKYCSSTLWLYIIPCSITIKSEGNPSLVSCWANSEKRIIFYFARVSHPRLKLLWVKPPWLAQMPELTSW